MRKKSLTNWSPNILGDDPLLWDRAVRVFDLTEQSAVCGDMISNIAMAVQQLGSGEEAKILLPSEYENNLDVYKDMLKTINVEVLETGKEGGKIYMIVKKS